MYADTIHERIKMARQVCGFKTATDAARAFGWTVSTYLGYENGDREPGKEMLQNISKAYGIGLHFLLMGEGVVKTDGSLNDGLIVGEIGGEAEVLKSSLVPEGLYRAESILPFAEGAMWFKVTNRSLWPRYDAGDLIGCSREGQPLADLIDGAECAVRLSDDRRYIRRIHKTSGSQLLLLESHSNPLIFDADVVWASAIVSTIRATDWTVLTEEPEKRERRKQMMAQAAAESGIFETRIERSRIER